MKQHTRRRLVKFWPFRWGSMLSLSQRLLGLIGVILLLMLLIIGAGVFFFIYQNEQHTWQGRQREAARYAGEVVAIFIDGTQNGLIMAGLLDRDELAAQPRIMDDLLQQSPTLLEIIRLDEKGTVFGSSYRDAPLLANLFTIPQSRWFLESQAGRLYLGKVQISAASEPYLIMAMPASDKGVVAARLHMDLLWDVVASLRFGDTGQAYVVNQDGLIIAHSNPEVPIAYIDLKERPETIAYMEASNHTWTGSYVNFEGTRVVGVAAPIPGTDWTVVTELPQREAFAVSRTALLILGGGMALFGLLVMGVTARLLTQLILRPMEKLRDGAEWIGYGHLDHRIEIQRQDEVGQVASAFNEMAARLHQRDGQLAAKTSALTDEVSERRRAEEALRQLNEELENRVAKRTAELSRVNEDLVQEIGERQRAEAALRQSEVKFRTLVEQIPAVTYTARLDEVGHTLYISPQIKTLLGFSAREWLTGPDLWREQLHSDDREQVIAERARARGADQPFQAEYRLLTRDNQTVWVQDAARVVRNEAGQPLFLQGVLFDITASKLAETKIRESLHEKEVLLKEIHHRVKNNLQVISSLLNLQSDYIEDPQAQTIFQDSQNRVRSMALIHEKLYRSENLAQIDFSEYIQDLSRYLFRTHDAHARITLDTQLDEVFLDIDTAMPCGLILNELISNIIKYAFPNGQAGKVWIALTAYNYQQLMLRVGDNGIGIPPDLDFQDTDSLGLQLVNNLVEQLEGTIELNNSQGTEFKITFTVPQD